MSTLRLFVDANLSQYIKVNRYAQNNQPLLLRTAAQRYVQFLQRRYIALASGQGAWPKLKRSTVLRKIRRGIADNPRFILREYNVLMNEIGLAIRGKQILVGYNRNRSHPRGSNVFFLVQLHANGNSRLPKRQIVVYPDRATEKRMVEDIKDSYNRQIRK